MQGHMDWERTGFDVERIADSLRERVIDAIRERTGEVIRELVSPRVPPTDGLGISLAAGGDFDADGVPDVLAGSIREPIGMPLQCGAAYLFSGATGAPLRALVPPRPQEIA